ncbi:transposase [Collinsella aerofaciens]|nr:transposase [Collinsella aerofaciens]MDB1908947.1 transposase [Collinsella aerofaciens]MDB1910838.1 transposase [Collinsella aerofaciens]MDB1912687.1 transposase [Collinsella aerofaciens]
MLDSAPVRNREAELDALFASAPAGTLVVVDQFRNIGSLAVRRARAAGLGVAYLPGLAASRAAGLFAGEAKTDERDAAVIARTALGVPDSLSGVPGRGEALEAARALSSQRSTCRTGGGWSCSPGSAGRGGSPAPGPRARGPRPPGRPRPPPPRPRRRSSRPRTGRSGSWPPGYRRPSTRPGPSRPRRRRCSRATRPTRVCSPCPASARGPRRSSRCRSTSGGSRTTTTWPRTAA